MSTSRGRDVSEHHRREYSMGSVAARRQNRLARRAKLIKEFGGKCQRCEYDRCMRALQFHHKDPSEKKAWSKSQGRATCAEIEHHPERFELLCANCHIEEHDKLQEEERTYGSCESCGKTFQTKKCLLAIGKDRFCSAECRDNAQVKPEETQETIAARFWKHTEKTDGCWNWTGQCVNGYPAMSVRDGRNSNRTMYARRASYELYRGKIGKHLRVKDTCGNPLCVNPDHLKLKRSGRPHGYQPGGPESDDQGHLF